MTKEQNDMDKPHMVTSHDIHLDEDYAKWIAELKHRYRSAQVKAAVKVNAEKLLFNWQLGRDLVKKKAEERWGAGVVEQVSLDMQKEFPDEKGFSAPNLWFMKKWYLFYSDADAQLKLQQFMEVLYSSDIHLDKKLYQAGRELQNEKLYQPGREMEKTKLHQAGGDFPSLFAVVPWRHHVEIITKCKTVEEALFYIGKTIEQGLSRDALVNCIKDNLYEHQGKIINNFYVNAVDELLKADDDNPTIGLLICSDLNKTEVQWSLRGIETPMGVATYDNIRIKDALPTQEQLRERMRLLQQEMKETKRLMQKGTDENNEGKTKNRKD